MSSVKHAARFVHHDGMTVYADRLTPTAMTEKPPVVMIHGGGHSGASYLLLPDYIVRRVEDFNVADVGLTEVGDINLDGNNDYEMIYSNGDEQYLMLFPITN